jgi:hypothetical protein
VTVTIPSIHYLAILPVIILLGGALCLLDRDGPAA